MKGGMFGFQVKKQIVNLLKNLIINNYDEDVIKKLCQPQSLPTAEQPLLLSTAKRPLLLKNANQVNELLIRSYRQLISPSHNYKNKFEYKFINNGIPLSIKNALNAKNISYFDKLVQEEHTVDILSPADFQTSLSSMSPFIRDKLVYSVFALASTSITLVPILHSQAQANMNLNDTECPPIADI